MKISIEKLYIMKGGTSSQQKRKPGQERISNTFYKRERKRDRKRKREREKKRQRKKERGQKRERERERVIEEDRVRERKDKKALLI